jgi:hypothetical protein
VPERLILGLLTATEVLAILTGVLVVVTGYYALQTRQTVNEMRRARGVAVLPRLVASLYAKGGGIGFVKVANVGPGPALDVKAVITFEPGGGRVEWRQRVVAPGESHILNPLPDGAGSEKQFELDRMTERFTHLRLVGTYADALGARHDVDDQVEIREWWRLLRASGQQLEHDWTEESAKALRKIATALETAEAKRRG